MAGALHDVGALTLAERLNLLQFDTLNPQLHAEIGYMFLKDFSPFKEIAEIVKYHHTEYNARSLNGIPIGSFIINLADKVDITSPKNKNILNHREVIKGEINKNSSLFSPEVLLAFNKLAEKEHFWLDLVNPAIDNLLNRLIAPAYLVLDIERLLEVSKLFSRIIDFRSRFTFTHSSGVAAVSEAIAKITGFTPKDVKMIKVAGYLHDLGKLAVPNSILEKPGKLTPEEYNIVKGHTYYTRTILANINGFEVINDWASLHHEKLDGTGYPFHYQAKDISIGSRILAVADIFTALSENRPYRQGLGKNEILQILNKYVKSNSLCASIVKITEDNYDEIYAARIQAESVMESEIESFQESLHFAKQI